MGVLGKGKQPAWTLVRDRAPDALHGTDRAVEMFRLMPGDGNAIRRSFRDKLKGKVDEVIDDPCVEEFADMIEVLLAYARTFGFTLLDIEEIRHGMHEERGGYNDMVMMRIDS